MRNTKKTLLVILVCWALGSAAYAGPVILGGDDLTDHGSVSGGANMTGWLYIENAIGGILANVTRAGAAGNGIAVLGAAASGATSGNAGAAIGSVGTVLGVTVTYYEGAAAISTFFSDLASAAVNPEILYLPGTGAANDLDTAEGAALTANAVAIAAFVASGGGVMAHGAGMVAYGWLMALLPLVVETSTCSQPVTLTAAGMTEFPGITNADVDAGPCHSTFSGDLGGLAVLAVDPANLNVIIGGASADFAPPVVEQIPTLGEWGAVALMVLLMLTGLLVFRRRGKLNSKSEG